jgi:hypothetical protein
MTTTQEEVFSRWLVIDVTFSLISRRRTSTDTALSLRSSVSVSNHKTMRAEGEIPFCLYVYLRLAVRSQRQAVIRALSMTVYL